MVRVHLIMLPSSLNSLRKVADFRNSSTVVASNCVPNTCFHYDTANSTVTCSTSSTPKDIFLSPIWVLAYLLRL